MDEKPREGVEKCPERESHVCHYQKREEAALRAPALLKACTGQLPSALKRPMGPWVPTGIGILKA